MTQYPVILGTETQKPEIPTTPIATEPPAETPQAKPPWLAIAEQANALFQKQGWKKRVAIVGFAPTRDQAPYIDPSWEIWGLNDLHNQIPRWSRWFDIHTEENIETDVIAGRTSAAARKVQVNEAVLEKMGISGLSKLTCPVYMQDKNPRVPWSVRFPLDEMVAFWERKGVTGSRYLTNSISFMVAYALFEGAVTGHQWDEIAIYGVDMAVGDEYVAQRPSCEYWIGIAEGMGVHVYIPPASDLCHSTFIYAYETRKQALWEQKINQTIIEAQKRYQMLQQSIAENQRLLHHAEAQIGTLQDFKKVWANLDTDLKPPNPK